MLILLQCFNNFWMGLILRDARERWKRNIITVCICSKISLLLHLCPNLYSSFPLSKVNQNHLLVLLVCWDPEIQKKDKKRYIKCHKVIKETKAEYVRFPALCEQTVQMSMGDEQELVSLQSQASTPCDEQEMAFVQVLQKGLKDLSETYAWSIVTTVVPSGDPKEKYKHIKSQQGIASLRQT